METTASGGKKYNMNFYKFVKEGFDKFKPIQDKNYISDYNRFDEQSRLILKENNY